MASVYLGYRADVDRTVAIKVLPPHPGMNEDAKHRFQLEARTIANLQHPHILPLYDYGATDDGVLYLVMPYVRGGSLDRIVRDGAMPLNNVARVVREISSALDYAHRQGIIHRDIKPANILIDGEGNALLADFGIVKLTGGDSRLTGTSVVGTPAYMSPEQAQGFDLSTRADLYSFGVVVFELLTGKLPYASDSVMNLMLKHITEPVPDATDLAPTLPRSLNIVMQRILAKDAQERYETATAFNDAFQQAITQRLPDAADAGTVVVDTAPPSRSTPAKPIQVQLSKNSAPITVPIDPSDPNRPGTIVIQPPAQHNNPLVFFALGIVTLIAVAALVIVLIGQDRTPAPDATQIVATQDSGISPEPTRVALQTAPVFGRASFSSSSDQTMGDSINLRVNDFTPAPSSRIYIASLLNTITGDRVTLGQLAVDAVGSGALSYIDPDARNLSTLYNAIEVSLEQSASEPTFEDVRYSSMLPDAMMNVMTEIFVASPNGFRGLSLYESASLDARFATQHAGLAANARNLGARRTHNEHTLNILLGGLTDYDGNGRGLNPGTRLGLLPILERIDDAIGTVADSPDAPFSVQVEAELVRVCLENVRVWSGMVIDYEQSMLLSDSFEATESDAQASITYADMLITGTDENLNEIIEPFEGECGLEQVKTFGLVVASFDLFEGALEVPEATASDTLDGTAAPETTETTDE